MCTILESTAKLDTFSCLSLLPLQEYILEIFAH
jgi:hypothetical protein